MGFKILTGGKKLEVTFLVEMIISRVHSQLQGYNVHIAEKKCQSKCQLESLLSEALA